MGSRVLWLSKIKRFYFLLDFWPEKGPPPLPGIQTGITQVLELHFLLSPVSKQICVNNENVDSRASRRCYVPLTDLKPNCSPSSVSSSASFVGRNWGEKGFRDLPTEAPRGVQARRLEMTTVNPADWAWRALEDHVTTDWHRRLLVRKATGQKMWNKNGALNHGFLIYFKVADVY